ncbi:MAG TPA: anti-sigma factor [Gemmatimonadales bacterium]|jgi:anti-sigma-K factor RskA
MSSHDWYVENRAAFVARSLDSDEERTYQQHLVHCEECAAEVRRLEQDLAWLPMGVTPAAPAPGLARRMTGAILDRQSRWQRRLPYLLAAASLLLAIGLGMRGRTEGTRLRSMLTDTQSRMLALQDTVSVLRSAQHVLQIPISAEGRRGGLLIFQDAGSHRWTVIVHGLPPAPQGNVYQFWFITESGMVRSVEVNADTSRPAMFTLPMPPVPAPVMGAALTVEPAISSSSEPQGPQLAHVTF